jgi:hypothetical protein
VKWEELKFKIWLLKQSELYLKRRYRGLARCTSPLEWGITEGENPVYALSYGPLRYTLKESSCLGMQLKRGGKYHPRLNIGERPIANKYREGKMKSTLKRELNST